MPKSEFEPTYIQIDVSHKFTSHTLHPTYKPIMLTLAHTSDTYACIHIRIHLVRYACRLGCTPCTGRDIPINWRTAKVDADIESQLCRHRTDHNYEQTYIYIAHTNAHRFRITSPMHLSIFRWMFLFVGQSNST